MRTQSFKAAFATFGRSLAFTAIGSCVLLASCAAQGERATKQPMKEGIEHRVSGADVASTKGATPLETPKVVLWINGMGCPQCVTNVDLQLERIKGAQDIRVDLSSGKVSATFTESPRPTPDRLAKAIDDAGLTLVKIESVK